MIALSLCLEDTSDDNYRRDPDARKVNTGVRIMILYFIDT